MIHNGHQVKELKKTINYITETSNFISILNEASIEQELGFGEINSGMLEISKSLITNVDIAENLFETVKILSGNSKELNKLLKSI